MMITKICGAAANNDSMSDHQKLKLVGLFRFMPYYQKYCNLSGTKDLTETLQHVQTQVDVNANAEKLNKDTIGEWIELVCCYVEHSYKISRDEEVDTYTKYLSSFDSSLLPTRVRFKLEDTLNKAF